MAPSPASRLVPGSSNGQRTPASTSRYKERHRIAAQSPSQLPFPSSPSDHPVEVIGRIRDHTESSERAPMLKVLNQGQMIRVKTDQGYRDFGLDGTSLAEKEDLQSFYEKYVESRIDIVKMGGRCTIMMYGPTGAGKSYTMFGSTKEQGIAYRALEKILRSFAEQTGHESTLKKLGVNVTILEIYNEEAFDLLAACSNTNNGHWTKPSRVRLEIMGKKAKNAVSISGSDAEKISKEIAKVERRRVVKSTLCNERSSRSHCLVMVDVPASGGRLVLVDMAGSENLEQAGLGSESKLQTGKINQGNVALKRVVEAIANGDSYIPFRDSKLTMLLQDSFEDDESKILMILCASTDPKDMHKTIGTLEYGSKAKCIVRLPTSPDKRKTIIDKLDLSALETKMQAMDAYISRLEAENINKDKEREEVYKKLMLRDRDLVALRKVVGQTEEERCDMVQGDDCEAEMERKLEECQRIADELIELGKKSLEEKVLEQQREIDMMRCRMAEIEREVQLLLKVNHQPQESLVSERVHPVGCPSFDSLEKDDKNAPCCLGSLAEVAEKEGSEDASHCNFAREASYCNDSQDAWIYFTSGRDGSPATCQEEMFVSNGWLPAIPEEFEGEDYIPDDEASQQRPHWESSMHEPGIANTDSDKSCGLTSTASRRSRIENIFMLCGNQRELTGMHSGLLNKQVEELRHQSKDASRPLAVASPLLYARPELQLSSSTEGPSMPMEAARKISASPNYSPVHIRPLIPKQTTSDSSPLHIVKHMENSPHGRSPLLMPSITKAQSLKSPRKLDFDNLSPTKALNTPNQPDTDQDADSCEVFVKWETSKDSCGKLIKVLSIHLNASLASLRKELESNVFEAKQEFTFLMLGDPSGAPVKRDNEANLLVASLPDCHKKQGSKLACLRPHARQGIPGSPLSPMENRIVQCSSLLRMGPFDVSFEHFKSPERGLTCQIIDGALTSHSAENAKIKQKLGFSPSPLLKGLRI